MSTTPPLSPRINTNYSRLTTLIVEGLQAKNITDKDTFIKFSVDGKKFKTKVHKKTQNPSWSDKYTITTTEPVEFVIFQIFSQNILGNDIRVGSVKIPIVSPNALAATLSNSSPSTSTTPINKSNEILPIITAGATATTATTTTTPPNSLEETTPSSTPSTTSAQISSSPSIPPITENGNNNNSNPPTITVSDTGFENFIIDNWSIVERDLKTVNSLSTQSTSELRVKITVKIRDIYFDTDSSSGTITDDSSQISTSSNVQPPPKDFKPEHVNPKEMSFIGKGGSQILKLTKKIASKIDKPSSSSSSSKSNKADKDKDSNSNSNSISPSNSNHNNLNNLSTNNNGTNSNIANVPTPTTQPSPTNNIINNIQSTTSTTTISTSNSSFINTSGGSNNKIETNNAAAIEKARREQQNKMIEEQLAKEQEIERVEKEKANAREKLRQLEQEEQHKKIETERREARRKEKEEKKKLEKENKYVPDKPIDYFFVCGLTSSKLDPIDQLNDNPINHHHQQRTTKLLPLEKSYKGELVEYYPHKDDNKDGSILPKHIWMYCFPRGISFTTEQLQPVFFPFVLTNETGTRLFASCLTFYEQVGDTIYSELQKETIEALSSLVVNVDNSQDQSKQQDDQIETLLNNSTISENSTTSPTSTTSPPSTTTTTSPPPTTTTANTTLSTTNTTANLPDDFPKKIYAPKCICVLSHYPYFSSFRVALNEIYHKVFFSSTSIPIERYIFNLVNEIPLPKSGKNPVAFNLGGPNNCVLRQPDECLLPEPDISYRMLFLCLDIKNVLSLIKCLLLEEKIIIISSQYTLLTYICEIITNLIHPLTYTHIYVPVLPEVLVDIAGSTPFPFIMGLHRSYSDRILSKDDLLNELVIVDLDNNTINIPTPTKDIQLPEKETAQLVSQLKKVVQFEIQSSDLPNFNPNTLTAIKTNTDSSNGIGSNRRTYGYGTSSYTSSSSSTSSNTSNTPTPPPIPMVSSNPDQHIRLSFLQYFCSLMGDYRKYYKYLRVFPQPIPIFNNEEYIKSKSVLSRPFVTIFIKTQAFIYFLEQHSWPTKNLFDYLVQSKKYTKSIDELQLAYQTLIPVSLGLQDQSNLNIIQSPVPSKIRYSSTSSSSTNSTLREFLKFPALKPELFGSTPSSPSSTSSSTSNSLASSATSIINSNNNSNGIDQLKPLYDIYVNCNNTNNNSNSTNQTTTTSSTTSPTSPTTTSSTSTTLSPTTTIENQFSFNDDQHKSFVTLIERFLDKIFCDQVPVDDIQQILDVLQFDYGRFIFGKLLLNHHKQNYVGSNVSQHILQTPSTSNGNNTATMILKTKLSDLVFNCLVDIIKIMLRECNTQLDFTSSQMLLESIFIYHRIYKGQNEYIQEKLQTNVDLWQNQRFWEKIFYDSIEQKCKLIYGNLINEMVEWSIKSDDTKKEIIKQEEDMAFSLLSNQTFKMITLGSTPDLVRRFVNRMCSSINLDSDTMLQVVSNMSRVRELSDLDENNHLDQTNQQNINVNNELLHRKHLMKEKEDSYQLISKINKLDQKNQQLLLAQKQNGNNAGTNGGDIFSGLFDEKGHVSLNKIMNIKASWDESKSSSKKSGGSHGSTKVPIKEISESRGDYVVKLFSGHQEGVLCSTMLQRENNLLITGSADSTLKVWDVTTTRCVNTLVDHGGWVTTCETLPDASKLISGSYDKTIKYWDLNKGQKIKSFRAHKGSITCLVNQDSNVFISGSYDNTINVWDLRSHKPSITLFGHQQAVTCLVANDQYRVISGSNDSNIRIWDIRTSASTNVLQGHSDWIKCLEVDNQDTLISGSCDGRVKVWSLENGECIKTLQSHSGSVNSILMYGKVDNDGTTAPKKFLTASSDSTLKVWDSNYGESYHCLEGHTDEVVNISKFINNFVVSASFDGTVKLWDVDNGRCKRTLYNHSNRISSLNTYDSSIVTTSWDKNAKIIQFNLGFRGGN